MEIDPEIRRYVIELIIRLGLFIAAVTISPFFGEAVIRLLRRSLILLARRGIGDSHTYSQYIRPFQGSISLVSAFLLVAIALTLLVKYEDVYSFLGFFVYSALAVTVGWLASRIARQVIHQSVIALVRRWFGEVSEIVLIFETLIYVVITLLAVVIFAAGLRVNLVALGAGLGISGAAVAFAAQQTLSRLFGTLELYLDRPYVSGEHIRVNFNPYGEDVYGRVEAVGLRSTKIRLIAQNTMMIVPNSTMASKNIENVSRGKKTMAMLCLAFDRPLEHNELALVTQVVERESQIFWGFDKASTKVQHVDEPSGTRTRIFFFITNPSKNSLELRKRLLDLANSAIAERLQLYNLTFTVPEPTVYVDSPMSL
ncbi:MAG: mechanosensitive ion channel family protein [Cyanobacteria bacterium P01_A01_bin.135]